MSPSAQSRTPLRLEGWFVLWEPDTRAAHGFRQYDTESFATSLGRGGKLSVGPDGLVLSKSRLQARLLLMLPLSPLCLIVAVLPWAAADKWLGGSDTLRTLTGPVLLPLMLFAAWRLLGLRLKDLRRHYPLNSIANVHSKFVQITSRGVPVRQGRLGVDFAVAPRSLLPLDPAGLPIPPSHVSEVASVDDCTYVSFIAGSEEAAASLTSSLPRTILVLTGESRPHIPPLQEMPRRETAEPVLAAAPAVADPAATVGGVARKCYPLDTREGWWIPRA